MVESTAPARVKSSSPPSTPASPVRPSGKKLQPPRVSDATTAAPTSPASASLSSLSSPADLRMLNAGFAESPAQAERTSKQRRNQQRRERRKEQELARREARRAQSLSSTAAGAAEGADSAAVQLRIAVQGGPSSHRPAGMLGGPSSTMHEGHQHTDVSSGHLGHLPNEKATHTAPHVLEAVPEQADSSEALDEEDRGSAEWDYDVTEDIEAEEREETRTEIQTLVDAYYRSSLPKHYSDFDPVRKRELSRELDSHGVQMDSKAMTWSAPWRASDLSGEIVDPLKTVEHLLRYRREAFGGDQLGTAIEMDERLNALLGKEGARRAMLAETRKTAAAREDERDDDPAERGEPLSKKNARAMAKVSGDDERAARRSSSDLLADCSESPAMQNIDESQTRREMRKEMRKAMRSGQLAADLFSSGGRLDDDEHRDRTNSRLLMAAALAGEIPAGIFGIDIHDESSEESYTDRAIRPAKHIRRPRARGRGGRKGGRR